MAIAARKVDESFEEYFRELIKPRYAFISNKRDELAAIKHPTEEQVAELGDMITSDKKIDNVWKLCQENYINEHNDGRCCMCRHRWACKQKQPQAFQKRGDLLGPAYEVLTKRCSFFNPLPGYGKPTDYKMFNEAHSTTTVVTDTTLSGQIYYAAGFAGFWATVWGAVNGTGTSTNNFTYGWAKNVLNKFSIFRNGHIYDLSALPAGATISAAKIMAYQYGGSGGSGTCNNRIQDGGVNPTDSPHIGDYDQSLYSGSYGDTNVGAHSATQYNDFPFTNFTTINMGGTTRHIIRELVHDIGNSEPADQLYWVYEGITHAGGHDPQIEITYGSGSISANKVIMVI